MAELQEKQEKQVVIVRAVTIEEMLNHMDDKLNYILQLLAEDKK